MTQEGSSGWTEDDDDDDDDDDLHTDFAIHVDLIRLCLQHHHLGT